MLMPPNILSGILAVTEGTPTNVFKQHFNKDVQKYRQVDLWNSLPADIVQALTMDTPKDRLDRYAAKKGGFL